MSNSDSAQPPTPASSARFHLAQFNLARGRAPIDDPLMAGFVSQLDRINTLAEQSPGFVWRLQDDSGDATSISIYDDPLLIVNLSVWEDVDSLFAYVYRSAHAESMTRRKQWFQPIDGPHMVLWWIPAGHLPPAEEGKQRLQQLRESGPGPEAFTFRQRFSGPKG